MSVQMAGALLNVLFWAFLAGLICGLLPLFVGNHRERPILGLAGFGLCITAGALLGWHGALPMALITALAIFAIGGPGTAKPPTSARPEEPIATTVPTSNEYLDFIPLDPDVVRADADL